MTGSENEQAETLSDLFESVFIKEPDGEVPTSSEKQVKTPPLEDINITKEMVMKKLKKFNVSKSQDPDEIGPRILKEVADEIAEPIAILYDNLLKSHKVPR